MCLTGTPLLSHADVSHLKLDHETLWRIAEGEKTGDFVIAWRGWKLKRVTVGGRLRLESANAGHEWHVGSPMKTHAAIKADLARVGVHAVKHLKAIDNVMGIKPSEKDCVLGKVLLWGDIATHDNGYRAEYGYPLVLYVNDLAVQCALRDAYGCPVRMRTAADLYLKGA